MFYCESCRQKTAKTHEREWPETMMKSHGACEICGEDALCNDLKSSLLSMPRRTASGTLLTEDRIAELSRRAEDGYDVDEILRRREADASHPAT